MTLAATASISWSVKVFSLRLQGDLQRQRFLALAEAFALEQVEHADAGDQLLVGRQRRLDDIASRHVGVEHEGEVAPHGQQIGGLERPRARPFLRCGGSASRNTSKAATGPATSSARSVSGWTSPKWASTILGPSRSVAGAAGMEPGRRVARQLRLGGVEAELRQQRDHVRLGIEQARPLRPSRTNGVRSP